MSFDWSHYFVLAQELVQSGDQSKLTEAKSRSAISRMYYSAFVLSRNYIREKQRSVNLPSDGQVHDIVRRTFNDSRDSRCKAVGANLGRLWVDRKQADYEDQFSNLENQVRLDILQTQQVIRNLDQLRTRF